MAANDPHNRPQQIGHTVAEISEKASLLVREEIALAKAEVTRAANSFGRTHLTTIREAYALIAGIVEKAQADGSFRDAVTPGFAALAFYGAIEQVLTGWIFALLPEGEEEFEQAKTFVVETVCGGLEAPTPTAI